MATKVIQPNIIELSQQALSLPPIDELKQVVQNKLRTSIKIIDKLINQYTEFMEPNGELHEPAENLTRLVASMEKAQAHLTFVSKILEENNLSQLKQDFNSISELYENLAQSSDVCLVPLEELLDTALKAKLLEIEKLTGSLLVVKKGDKLIKNDKEDLAQAKILTAKLDAIFEYFPGLVAMEHDDIFTHPKSSPLWEKLFKDTKFRRFEDKATIQASIETFCKVVTLANAVMYKRTTVESKVGSKTLSKLIGALSGLYYSTQQDKAETRASLLFAHPEMESAFKVWHLPDNKWVKEAFKLTLPSIDYDNKIYIPRLFPMITKESILKEYENGTNNTITPSNFQAPNLTEHKEEILSTLFKKNSERVKIRILSPWPLVIKGKTIEKVKAKVTMISRKLSKDMSRTSFKDDFNGVLFHIHGGGFVSMSSSAHRNYLYRWAKSLNMIIFSVDYRLAPTNPYPEGLDDVWQAYNWLINYSEPILGIPIDRIVVAGDSAGGNLAMSLALRTIKEGVKVPDGCFLSYPALSLYPKKVIPSYFVAIDNTILPYNMLKLCLKAYIPEEFKPESDPFLSPLMASDELLAKAPAIRIVTGNDDPLHDDNWKFLHRLQNLKKDVKMTVYEGMPHGFLSLEDLIDYELLIAETVGRIRELFYSVDQKEIPKKSEETD